MRRAPRCHPVDPSRECANRGGRRPRGGRWHRSDAGEGRGGHAARLARRLRPVKTLLEVPGQMTFNTHFTPLFSAFGEYLERHLWLLTDVDCQGHSEDFPYPPGEPRLLSGVALRRIAAAPGVDFDWGVLSGFTPGTDIDIKHLAVVP